MEIQILNIADDAAPSSEIHGEYVHPSARIPAPFAYFAKSTKNNRKATIQISVLG